MIIGFDGSRAFVKERTGTENYSYQLLRAIAKVDAQNSYLIYLRASQEKRVNRDDWPENFKFKVINYAHLWTQVGLALKTFIDPLDVLFVPAHTFPLIRKPGLKTVITVHDLGAEYLPAFHQLKQVMYLKLMTHIQLKTASKIIAVSESTKLDLVERIGIKPGKIAVIYEGPNDLSADKDDNKRDLLRYLDIDKKKYFLFVGTIQPRKNLVRLIQAFESFNWAFSDDYKLVLAGKKGWLYEDIYKQAESVGLEKRIVFTGQISNQDLRTLYKNALALTFPSLFEGFGLPILEAFEYNCPVITSNVSSMPEVAGEAALLINPLSTDEITEAMIKLAKNDSLRSSLIIKGNIQLAKFSWEKSAKETAKILMEAIK